MRHGGLIFGIFVLLFVLFTASAAWGQTFEISSPDQMVPAGGGSATFSATFSIVQVTGALEETKGFSMAYGHDSTLLEVVGSNPYIPTPVGSLAALNGGTGPDFIQGEVFTNGFTVGVIYAFVDQSQVITFGTPLPMIEVDYATIPGALSGSTGNVVTTISSASDLGTPPATTVVVIGAGSSAPTTGMPFSITFQAAPPMAFEVICVDQAATFSSSTGVGSFTGTVQIDQDVEPGDTAAETQGFSLGVAHDAAVLEATAVDYGASLASLEGGTGPEFFNVGIISGGITVGCIYDFQGGAFIGFDTPTEAVLVQYDTVPGALVGTPPGASISTTLTPTSGLGPTGVTMVMVVDGQSIDMTGQAGSVLLTAIGGFNRGDCNDDFSFNIGDAITLLDGLFLGGVIVCANACDSNDDNQGNIADAVHMLAALFNGGPMPPGTGSCAPDPTPGALGCEDYTSCS
ncbi:MAG TPA: hypothetical protein EYQ08_10960 [Planctomycetes bacterium]|nr:hypothetical protein [Planctomycetota bacterium]HIK81360.1 hypothetical protein [Planctomycetota bacterium]